MRTDAVPLPPGNPAAERNRFLPAPSRAGGSAEDPALRRWVYDLTVPVMVVGRDAAQRAEVHLSAALCTPFSEEKMRFGCQLQCSCDLYPRCAVEMGAGLYRLTYDARISLYSTALRAGCA